MERPRPQNSIPGEITPPVRDAPETVPVVAAVIRRHDGAVLLARRAEGKRHGGLWEFPGGKVLEGESYRDALRRELSEELSVEVTEAGDALFSARDPGLEFLIHFVDAEIRGEPVGREHAEVRWVTERELARLPLAPADRDFASALAMLEASADRKEGRRRPPPPRPARS